ncbi:hypothetical protein EVAR_37543_1 [Eumeta japonica]|uniref:DUF5641 domain-containing protein n=1 Tax=Eumeta variegata TaxID=151549 RepID=A0A4C1XQE7_EUMVA|nr:hypothetical protein EVAR_37543_1 [Eumeta japonica]
MLNKGHQCRCWSRQCCARGRPIIVEWERDARHSAGLSLVRLVLIKDDNQLPLKRHQGRAVRLLPGPEGVSRVAEIRTATEPVRRVFSKICPLPVQPYDDEP